MKNTDTIQMYSGCACSLSQGFIHPRSHDDVRLKKNPLRSLVRYILVARPSKITGAADALTELRRSGML